MLSGRGGGGGGVVIPVKGLYGIGSEIIGKSGTTGHGVCVSPFTPRRSSTVWKLTLNIGVIAKTNR